jgi:hypothetical protein
LLGDKFCTNGVVDRTKIDASCEAKTVQPLCAKTFCPPDYVVGSNCNCCPIKGIECDKRYFGKYCTGSPAVVDPSKIADGCPTKDEIVKTIDRVVSGETNST